MAEGEKEKQSLMAGQGAVAAAKQPPARIRGRYSRMWQLIALVVKQLNLQKRAWGTNVCQLATPVLLMLVLVFLQTYIDQVILNSSSNDVDHPKAFPPYTTLYRSSPVASLLTIPYTRSLVINESLIGEYGSFNGSGVLGNLQYRSLAVDYSKTPPGGLGSSSEDAELSSVPFQMQPFDSESAINDLLFEQFGESPDKYPFAYSFQQLNLVDRLLQFQLFYNNSITAGTDLGLGISLIAQPLIRLVTRGGGYSVLTSVRDVPQVSEATTFDLASLAGPFFYNLILHQLLPVIMFTIVLEKELRLREFMKMMGLRMSNYWVVNFVWSYLLYFLLMNFMVIMGWILAFRYFTINNLFVYYLLFLIWGFTLISMAFLLSVFINKGRTALVLGYLYILMLIPVTIWLVGDLVRNPDTSEGVLVALSLVPSFALYRALSYLTLQVQFNGPGYAIEDLAWDSPVSIGQVYVYLLGEGLVCLILTWYLEQTLPSGFGVKRSPFFLFQPSYWRRSIFFKWTTLLRRRKGARFDRAAMPARPDDPTDVVEEEERTLQGDSAMALRVFHMVKEYSAGLTSRFRAVDGVTLHAEHGECLGMLGPNGAGKTTLLSILSGLFEPTAGSAEFYGFDLHSDIEAIHSFMGVCPQFDIVWPDMTGSEHMWFYGRLKNVPFRTLGLRVEELLRAVNLWNVRGRAVSKYSGGMRRRLSVAISLIGEPKVVFLDEPSTGLDPRARQSLWELINSRKPTCCMILTTHSMEEAEALSDRIVIMSRGRVRAVGTSASLKARYADGFLLSVNYRSGLVLQGEARLRELLPDLHLERSISSTRDYRVGGGARLSTIFSLLENHRADCFILDWGVRNSTLEEAFEKITADDFRRADEEFLHDYSDSEYGSAPSSDEDVADLLYSVSDEREAEAMTEARFNRLLARDLENQATEHS